MKWLEKFFEGWFHKHDWRVVSAQVSGSWQYVNASVTLECVDCKRRKYHEKGVNNILQCFPTQAAGKDWIESVVPPEAVDDFKNMEWDKNKDE